MKLYNYTFGPDVDLESRKFLVRKKLGNRHRHEIKCKKYNSNILKYLILNSQVKNILNSSAESMHFLYNLPTKLSLKPHCGTFQTVMSRLKSGLMRCEPPLCKDAYF